MESLRFIIDVALILFAAKAFGILARKLHAPEVVGEIIAGLILGPAIIGIVDQSDFINKMAEIGVIMLMFEAGLTTDMKKLKATGLKATVIACAGVFVPLILGAVLFMSFYGFGPIGSEQFIKGLLEHMGSDAVPHAVKTDDDTYHVELVGENLGMLIGRRGDTLDAIQHLVNYSVNRGSEKMHISVDAENYRSKREESLARLAEKMAEKAIKYKRSMALVNE